MQWEYKIVEVKPNSVGFVTVDTVNPNQIEKQLNELGRQGREMVTAQKNNLILKRRK